MKRLLPGLLPALALSLLLPMLFATLHCVPAHADEATPAQAEQPADTQVIQAAPAPAEGTAPPPDPWAEYCPGYSSLPELLAMLQSDKPSVQFCALSGLTQYWGPLSQLNGSYPPFTDEMVPSEQDKAAYAQIVETTAGLLRSEMPYVRRMAGQALGLMMPTARPYLLALIEDPDPQVTLAAASSYAFTGSDPEFFEIALRHLTETDTASRGRFVYVISQGNDRQRVKEVLLGLAKSGFEDYSLESSLADLGEAVIPDLLELLKSSDAVQQEIAAKALGVMGAGAAPAFDALLDAVTKRGLEYYGTWEALYKIANADPQRVYPLMFAVRRGDAAMAMQALDRADSVQEPSPRFVHLARVWFSSQDYRMRIIGARLLSAWKLNDAEVDAVANAGDPSSEWNRQLIQNKAWDANTEPENYRVYTSSDQPADGSADGAAADSASADTDAPAAERTPATAEGYSAAGWGK